MPTREEMAAQVAHKQQLILRMHKSGQIDNKTAGQLMADSTRKDIVEKDARAGFAQEDSPTGHLSTLALKLNPTKSEEDERG